MISTRKPWRFNQSFDCIEHFEEDGTPLCNIEIEPHLEAPIPAPTNRSCIKGGWRGMFGSHVITVCMNGLTHMQL